MLLSSRSAVDDFNWRLARQMSDEKAKTDNPNKPVDPPEPKGPPLHPSGDVDAPGKGNPPPPPDPPPGG